MKRRCPQHTHPNYEENYRSYPQDFLATQQESASYKRDLIKSLNNEWEDAINSTSREKGLSTRNSVAKTRKQVSKSRVRSRQPPKQRILPGRVLHDVPGMAGDGRNRQQQSFDLPMRPRATDTVVPHLHQAQGHMQLPNTPGIHHQPGVHVPQHSNNSLFTVPSQVHQQIRPQAPALHATVAQQWQPASTQQSPVLSLSGGRWALPMPELPQLPIDFDFNRIDNQTLQYRPSDARRDSARSIEIALWHDEQAEYECTAPASNAQHANLIGHHHARDSSLDSAGTDDFTLQHVEPLPAWPQADAAGSLINIPESNDWDELLSSMAE